MSTHRTPKTSLMTIFRMVNPRGFSPEIFEEEEEENTALPRIERDLELEEEIEKETQIPVEKIIEDVSEVGQMLDPMRRYLREIGRHELLTAEQQTALAERIQRGLQADERPPAGDR